MHDGPNCYARMECTVDICIVGGGIAGCTLARALAAAGASVAVADRGPIARGAGWAAAGMLAPLVEARVEERELAAFSYEALRFYPEFVEALQRETGRSVDYRAHGTLIVGVDRDDAEQVRHQFEEQRRLGLPVEWLNGYECRGIEPCLAPGIPGGIFSRHDHQVDNRLLLEALYSWCAAHPNVLLLENLGEGTIEPGPSFRAGETVVCAGTIVLATGADAGLLRPVAPALADAMRPVKGQIMRLDQSRTPLLEHVVRTPDMYLVPKSNGAVVLGASSEDRGFDAAVTAGEIFELLRAAWECVPGIYELPIAETMVGFRPASIDNAPLLGPSGVEGIAVALGYYRHGILLAPFVADLLAAWLLRGERSRWLTTFSPERVYEPHTERATDRG